MLLILVIPAGLTATFGRMVGSRRQGWALYSAMLVLFLAGVAIVYAAEVHGTPAQHAAGSSEANLEGKETRFGMANSALWTVVTTVASCGAVNAAHDALTGIGGAVPLANMMTGEVIFGGVGSGLYGMLLFVLLAVFIAGLMVGPHARVPRQEDRGARDQARRARDAGGAAARARHDGAGDLHEVRRAVDLQRRARRASPRRSTPTSSQANNNGSAFAGYTGFVQPNAPGNVGAFGITFADLLGGVAMLLGRFAPLVLALAVAGSLATQADRARRPRHDAHRHGAPSSCCWSATSCSSRC